MTTLNKKKGRESTPSSKPVKPKKPLPGKEKTVKIPVPCSVLTEKRVREIAREEIVKRAVEMVRALELLKDTASDHTSRL